MMDDQTTPTTEVAARPSSAARIGILGALAAGIIGAAILIFGTTTTPAGTLAAANGATSTAVDVQGRGPGDGDMGGFGGHGFGGITITAISGSNISLKTVDGWTRSITIASDTALTKGPTTIALSDLKVGDEIRFAQARQADGSFTITKLTIVLPHARGAVTAVSDSSITVTRLDGTATTIKVTSSTTYEVDRTTGKALTDVKIGMLVGAIGTLNSDGSLTATAVHAFDPASFPGREDHGGHGPWDSGHGPWNNGAAPDASPDGSADASAG